MKNFVKGLFTGGDENASMAKIMAWIIFIVIIFSWFAFPERGISELSLILGGLLGYTLGGKWAWQKRQRKQADDQD